MRNIISVLSIEVPKCKIRELEMEMKKCMTSFFKFILTRSFFSYWYTTLNFLPCLLYIFYKLNGYKSPQLDLASYESAVPSVPGQDHPYK